MKTYTEQQRDRKPIVFNFNLIDFKLCLFAVYNLAYVLYMLGLVGQIVHYALLILFIGFCGIQMLGRNKTRITEMVFWEEFMTMGISICVFAVISLIIQFINNDFRISYVSSYLYLIIPLVTVFLWANTTESKKQMMYLYVFLARFILTFILSNAGNLSMSSIKAISFSDSMSSAYESSDAHCFFILVLIFMYKKKQVLAIISGIFCMLCFKRLSFILTPVVLLLFSFIPKGKPSKAIIRLSKAFFIIVPFIVLTILRNLDYFNELFGIDLNMFTSNRFAIVQYVMDNIGYFNGYGSVSAFLDAHPWGQYIEIKHMHCDLVQFYLETTIIGVVVFVNNLFEIAKKNAIVYCIVLYYAIEMFTSHFVEVLAAWIILYMFIVIAKNDKTGNVDNTVIYKPNIKKKKPLHQVKKKHSIL